jgi:intracellular septation protein A
METEQPALKHWRSFGTKEWGHVKEGALGLLLGTLLPVVLFYGGYRVWGFSTAVLIVLSWSVLIFGFHLRRTGGADVFSATTFGFAVVKALAGLTSNNQWLYLAWPSLENIVYGVAFFGSALLGRPLLALFAQRLYPIPASVRSSDAFQRAFLITSGVWLLGHSLRAVLRLWLLSLNLPLAEYLIADTIAGWPINVGLMAFTAWFPLHELRGAGFMSVGPAPMTAIDAVDLAVEETAPTTV